MSSSVVKFTFGEAEKKFEDDEVEEEGIKGTKVLKIGSSKGAGAKMVSSVFFSTMSFLPSKSSTTSSLSSSIGGDGVIEGLLLLLLPLVIIVVVMGVVKLLKLVS